MSTLFFGSRERRKLMPAVSAQVLSSASYLTSMEFVLSDRLRETDLRSLRRLRSVSAPTYRPRAKDWPYILTLHSPDGPLLAELSSVEVGSRPTAVTVSLEIATRSPAAADDLVRFLASHFLPVSWPSQMLEVDGESIRFRGLDGPSKNKATFDIAVSAARTTKQPRDFCCKVDVRRVGRLNPWEWLKVDHRSWWANGMVLHAVPTIRSVGELWETSINSEDSGRSAEVVGRQILRIASSPLDGSPSVWNLVCLTDARRLPRPDLVRLENSWLLPAIDG
jgi:hypothetical protein